MPYSSLPLTPSQETLVHQVVDAIADGLRVSLHGEPGSGRSTIARAAIQRLSNDHGRDVAVLSGYSANRLAWDVARLTDGDSTRPSDLTAAGRILLIDDGECQIRIRENDPILIVGDYCADLELTVPDWTDEDIAAATPELIEDYRDAAAHRKTARALSIASAVKRAGLTTAEPLASLSTNHHLLRLIEHAESQCPLAIDFLFAASELGTLPISGDWFVGWRDLDRDQISAAINRLADLALIDRHSFEEWSTPSVVRAFVRRQMTVAVRKAASVSLAKRLMEINESQRRNVLPHLTTLWKRLRPTHAELSEQIWEQVGPEWSALGFESPENDDQVSASDRIRRQLVEARRARQQGAALQSEQLLANAVRQAESDLSNNDPLRFDVRIEYAEVSLTGPRRQAAVAELQSLLSNDFESLDERQTLRIENDLASALFFDGKHARAATAFEVLADRIGTGSAAGRAWNNAGESLRALGRLDDAAVALRKSLEVFHTCDLPDEPTAVSARVNLGNALADAGFDAEAADHFELATRLREEQYGPAATPTLVARLNWTLALCRLGRIDEAEQTIIRPTVEASDLAINRAFDIARVMIDLFHGRRVKAELQLLRLASSETGSTALHIEAARLLSELYRREQRADLSGRWARTALEEVVLLEQRTPVAALRTYLTAALANEMRGSWDVVHGFVSKAHDLLARCGGSIDQERTELNRVALLSSKPGKVTWLDLEDALQDWRSTKSPTDLPAATFGRIAEHAAVLESTNEAAVLIDRLIDDMATPPRSALVVRASLAVLNETADATVLWARVVELPGDDPQEQAVAEKILAELQATSEFSEPTSEPTDLPANGLADNDLPVNERREKLNQALRENWGRSLPFDEAALSNDASDSVISSDLESLDAIEADEESGNGHALDDLF